MQIKSGIDLVERSRFSQMDQAVKDRLMRRVCADDEEIKLIVEASDPTTRLACIFALKESFSKALGTGIGTQLSFKDIKVSYTELGQPQVQYIGDTFKEEKAHWRLSCSISHSDSHLVAMVMILVVDTERE